MEDDLQAGCYSACVLELVAEVPLSKWRKLAYVEPCSCVTQALFLYLLEFEEKFSLPQKTISFLPLLP